MLDDDPETVPAALKQRPELTERQWQLVVAFFNLSASRSHGGFAPNPISVTDAITYARIAGFFDEMHFLSVMQSLDAVFLEWVAEDQRKKNGRHRKSRS